MNQHPNDTKPTLVKARPQTAGTRHAMKLKSVKSGIQWRPKELSVPSGKTGGRNHSGVLVCRHIGGGNKQRLRKVQPLWPGHNVLVLGTQWAPFRTSPLSLVLDRDHLSREKGMPSVAKSSMAYVISGEGITPGSHLVGPVQVEGQEKGITKGHQRSSEILPNTRCQRSWIPVGGQIYDRSRNPESPMKSSRFKSSGVCGVILAHGYDLGNGSMHSKIRCPSGEERRVPSSSYATVGKVSCEDHALEVIGKAGKRRALGIRPTVRGCAMNPIDHPHGGRTKGGRHDVTPWAFIAKGQSTRADQKRSPFVLKTARQSKHGYLESVTVQEV